MQEMGENSEKKVLCSPNNVRPVTSQLRETAVDRSPICESGLMTAGDTRFFRSQRKGRSFVIKLTKSWHFVHFVGEIAEWRDELRRTDLSVQKQAVKKGDSSMKLFFPWIVVTFKRSHRSDDRRQGCLFPLSWHGSVHANSKSRVEETRISLFDQLCQIKTRTHNFSCEHVH